jgi:hypothetical protein
MFFSVLSSLIAIGGPVPASLRSELVLSPVYTQHVDVHSLPIVASRAVHRLALDEAAWLIERMIGHRRDVLQAMAANRTRFVIMGVSEYTTDVPEHQDLDPRTWWDTRARGLGATHVRPAVSCGEENLLALDGDPYATENILVHEFAHAVHEMGLATIDPTFDARLRRAYMSAIDAGLWTGTYAATNHREYWAEGVQSWFDTNRSDDNQHNSVDTREELKAYDPFLAALCQEIFRDEPWRYISPRRRMPGTQGTSHLRDYDRVSGRRFQWDPARRAAYEFENARRQSTAQRDGESTHEWLRRRSAAKCPEAMVDLGRRFRDGDGVERDHERARHWYTQAAALRYPPALDHLGWLLWRGDASVRDHERARFYLERSARAGHVQAMLNMASFDPDNASDWWTMAAQHGHPEARAHLKAATAADSNDSQDDS